MHKVAPEEMILTAVYKIIQNIGTVESLGRLKTLTENDFSDKSYRVGLKRLRMLVMKSGFIDVKIDYVETHKKKKILKCPICEGKTKKIKNRTIFGQLITSGYKCTRCTYWTGVKYRRPRKYTFHIKRLPSEKKIER
jgi:hypothetical protein